MNVGSEFEEYLKNVTDEKINSVSPVAGEDGQGSGYRIETANSVYYVSSDFTESDASFYAYYPGTNNNWSSNSHTKIIEDSLNECIPSGTIHAVAKNNKDNGNVASVVSGFAKETDTTVSSIVSYQHSGSYGPAVEAHSEFVKDNQSVETSVIISSEPGIPLSAEEKATVAENFSESNVTTQMIIVGDNKEVVPEDCLELGVDVYGMKYLTENGDVLSGHSDNNKRNQNEKIFYYVTGSSDKLNEDGTIITHYEIGETGQIIINEDVSIEDLRSGKNSNSDLIADSLSVNEFSSEIDQYLTNLDMDSSYVSSDSQYVEQFAASVFSSFKSDSIFSTNLSTDNGNDPFLNSINGSLNSYYDAVGQSLNSLALETKAIVSAGQSVADMDRYLSNLVITQFGTSTVAGTVTFTNYDDVFTNEMGINTMMQDYGTQIANCSINGEVLRALLNNSALSSLSTDGMNKNSTAVVLDNFINNNTTLQGPQWDMIRKKLSEYSNLFELRIKTATGLSDAIKKAVGLLVDYLGEYDYLDSSELEEIKLSRLRCEEKIVNLENEMNRIIIFTKMIDGVETNVMDYKHDEGTRDSYRNEISNLRNNVIPEIDRLIAKLEGLNGKYLEAMNIINTASSNVKTFYDGVKSIVPSNVVTFNV